MEDSNGEMILSLPLIVQPLINKTMLRRECSVIENSEDTGRGVKNFKSFKKVLPSFVTAGGNGGSSRSGRSRATTTLNITIEAVLSKRPAVKFVHLDYAPGTSTRSGPHGLPPLVVENHQSRSPEPVEVESPPSFDIIDEFIQPLPEPGT